MSNTELKPCPSGCFIGLLHHNDYSELATLDRLKEHIEDNIEYNKSLDADPILRTAKHLRAKVWTLKSYGDCRKSTDLTRFFHCPICGNKIDWAEIRRANDG